MLPRHISRLLAPLQPRLRPTGTVACRLRPVGRTFSGKSEADEHMERLQEQYATAKDEFEIASEESDKNSIYAADDRKAAKDELATLKDMYQAALEKSDTATKSEIQRRVGQRLRELESAVSNMFRKAEFGESDSGSVPNSSK